MGAALRGLTELAARLRATDSIRVQLDEPLGRHTRFGIGGPASLLAWASTPAALAAAYHAARATGVATCLLGEGSNVVVADQGFAGLVLRYVGDRLAVRDGAIEVEAGASLQSLVDLTIERGLAGMHTLTRIPGSVGGAIYGNAGAYGHQIDEFVERVDFLDRGDVRSFGLRVCRFEYRESAFKRSRHWWILGAKLRLPDGDPTRIRRRAAEIRAIRDTKFPPDMRCAGSIFKNLYLRALPAAASSVVPARAVREGKVASAYFLERVGAKGMRCGGIRVAHYHANLLYNCGGGTADQIRRIVEDLKGRVLERFGFELEEEVQYVG